jgi:metallophosphoesterase superfamily enzyme
MQFTPRDRAVYLPATDALVCADLHVGRAAVSNVESGLGERDDLVERFEALLERFAPAETVLAGDFLHAFDSLPRGAAETVRDLSEVADEAGSHLVVTPGNHDTMLDGLWDGPTATEYRLDGTGIVVTHGHERPELDADCYVVGHDHPTIEIEGQRRACYLYGPEQYGAGDVLMVPSFSRLPAGVVVNRMTAREFQSPLVTDADGLRPVVRDERADETHEFPPLGEFRRML